MTAILGGGISGLSAAYYALENPKLGPVVLLEASNRLGGWIRSQVSPTGTVFEQGPRTIRITGIEGRNTLDLVEHLGLATKVVAIDASHPGALNRMIYANKKLCKLPSTFIDLIKISPPFKRPIITVILTDLVRPKYSQEDDSIYNFCKRRLGEDIADYIISPLVCGICAGDAKEISVKLLLKSLFEAEQLGGSIVRGKMKLALREASKPLTPPTSSVRNDKELSTSEFIKTARKEKWIIWSLEGGLEQLPVALADYITKGGVDLKVNNICKQIHFKENSAQVTVNGETKQYDRIISSLPARNLAELVKEQHPQLAKELEAITAVTVGVVNLQFPGNCLPFQGFGVLVPPKEEMPILGIIFDSCIIPQSSTVLTVMMGGAWFKKHFGESPSNEQLLSVAVAAVKDILDIGGDPTAHNVAILRNCIPQYVVGHSQRIKRIKDYISTHRIPLALCGSSYEGISLNDVILSAKQAVSNIK